MRTDMSIAYQNHTDEVVRLYLIETMAFRVLTPEAAVRSPTRRTSPRASADRGPAAPARLPVSRRGLTSATGRMSSGYEHRA